MKMTIFVLVLCFILSCGKDDDCPMVKTPVCAENYDGPLDILWTQPLRSDTTLGSSIYPVIYKDHILYATLSLVVHNTIYSLNPDTGERQWEWEDYEEPPGNVIQYNNYSQGFDDKFYFNYRNYKILIDIDGPTTEMNSFLNFSSTRISAGIDHLYAIQFYDRDNNGIIWDSEMLRRRTDQQSDWEPVYFQAGTDTSRIIFVAPVEWINSANDTLIIFGIGRVEVPTRSDLIAYNITKDKIEWKISNISDFGEISYHLPILKNNLFYITHTRTISCVDPSSGIELWETEDLETSFSQCAPVIGGDQIFVVGDSGKARGINLNDGSIKWRNDETNNNPANMAYYDGGIYFCSNSTLGTYLYGLDANTGVVFLREESPNTDCKPNSRFSFGVSIDQETGRMYTLDGNFAMCLQLEAR